MVVFMGRYQPTGPGYALVVPRPHIADLHELGEADCGPMLSAVRRVSMAVLRTFGVTGTTIKQNDEPPWVPWRLGLGNDGLGGGLGGVVVFFVLDG